MVELVVVRTQARVNIEAKRHNGTTTITQTSRMICEWQRDKTKFIWHIHHQNCLQSLELLAV